MRPKAGTADLAKLISTHAPYDGEFLLRLPGIFVAKVSQPTAAFAFALQQPAACIVVAGAKKVMIGGSVYEYRAGHVAVYSVDLPIAWQVTEATHTQP